MMKNLIASLYKKIGIKTLKPFKIDKNINKALDKMSSINK
jgi:agmatinase